MIRSKVNRPRDTGRDTDSGSNKSCECAIDKPLLHKQMCMHVSVPQTDVGLLINLSGAVGASKVLDGAGATKADIALWIEKVRLLNDTGLV